MELMSSVFIKPLAWSEDEDTEVAAAGDAGAWSRGEEEKWSLSIVQLVFADAPGNELVSKA